MKIYRTGELVALLCAIGWLSVGALGASRFNHFDPIFADEDSDAHTVSAGSSNTADNNSPRILEIQNRNTTVISARVPPLIGDDGDSLFTSNGRTTASVPRTSVTNLPRARIESAIALSTLSANNNNNNSKRHLANEDYLTSSSIRPKKQTEKPQHWSALESYYETLRRANSQPVNPDYQVVPYLIEQKLDNVLQPGSKMQPIYAGKSEMPSILQSLDNGPTKSSPAWLLPTAGYQPIYSGGAGFTQQQRQQQQSKEASDVRLPERTIFVPRQQGSQGTKNNDGFQELLQKTIDSSYTNSPVAVQFWPSSSQPQQYSNQQRPIAQLPPQYPAQATDIRGSSYAEFLQAQDILHTAQLRNKEKSWDENFDPTLDRGRLREQLELESYCGPRNRMDNLDMSYQLVDSTKSLSATRINELLTSAKPGAFPSHMGLYNGSSPTDDAFLCGATWVHERFALTLASCIPSKPMNSNKELMLTVRAGEWKALQPKSRPDTEQRPVAPSSFTRRIKSVHIFPKYQANSSEHNLALIEWTEPTYFMSNYTFISPACPLRTRLALPAGGTCWAPVRNISFSEYFDAEGEGETKLRRNVGMKQEPIKLLNDDTDCRRETLIEFFNFQHPNYICSADIKRSLLRASLNQTDSFGSGIFCYDGAQLTLVSIVHPVQLQTASQYGYMDLTYYRPWVQSVISSSRAII